MYLENRRSFLFLVAAGFFFNCLPVAAVEFEPGVGVGVEYTDNVKLTQDNKIADQIATAFVGAKLAENEGYLKYDVKASANKVSYIQNTYDPQDYYYLAANANWEMIPERFNWILSDTFSQRLFKSLDPNRPDNIQDTNAFRFGAKINAANQGRHKIEISPFFSQYYYESSSTDNKQYSLLAKYAYGISPTLAVGFKASARKVDYRETAFADTQFNDAAFIIVGQRVKSQYDIGLGATNVKRDFPNGTSQDNTGFSGNINFTNELSSRSKFKAVLLSNITDTSTISHGATSNFQNDLNIADVIRNSLINLSYNRADEQLRSRIFAEYRRLDYSQNNANDRIDRSVGISVDYPVTQLLSSGVYGQYKSLETPEANPFREDKIYTVGGHLKYRFSQKLFGSLDLKYRKKDSTEITESFDELTVFANLVYGFSSSFRPSRAGIN